MIDLTTPTHELRRMALLRARRSVDGRTDRDAELIRLLCDELLRVGAVPTEPPNVAQRGPEGPQRPDIGVLCRW